MSRGAEPEFRGIRDDDDSSDARKARSRTVTFRVSRREFDAMMRASEAAGARSLSAFARAAVLDHVRALQTSAVTLSGDLTMLTRTLTDTDQALQEASRRIRRVLGSGAAGASGAGGESRLEGEHHHGG